MHLRSMNKPQSLMENLKGKSIHIQVIGDHDRINPNWIHHNSSMYASYNISRSDLKTNKHKSGVAAGLRPNIKF